MSMAGVLADMTTARLALVDLTYELPTGIQLRYNTLSEAIASRALLIKEYEKTPEKFHYLLDEAWEYLQTVVDELFYSD